MSGMRTQRFYLVIASDGDVTEIELVDALDALGYHGLMVLEQERSTDHEHPCPSEECLKQLRHEGHFIPADMDCCVCWGTGNHLT